jgi:hypothetical protein
MEPIEPPTDYFSRLPSELKIETMLDLPYEEIIDNCGLNRAFSKLCNNPYFWKAKLKHDYPDEILPQLEGPQYRAQYEIFLSEDINNEIEKLYRKIRDQLFDLTEKIGTIAYNRAKREFDEFEEAEEVASQDKEGKKLVLEKHNLEDSYNKEKDKLENEIKSLLNRARKVLPLIEEKKYIKLDGNLEELAGFKSTIQNVRKYLRKYGYNEPINPGNIFGIVDTEYSNSPSGIIYFYSDFTNKMLLYEVIFIKGNTSIFPSRLSMEYNTKKSFLKDYPNADFNLKQW